MKDIHRMWEPDPVRPGLGGLASGKFSLSPKQEGEFSGLCGCFWAGGRLVLGGREAGLLQQSEVGQGRLPARLDREQGIVQQVDFVLRIVGRTGQVKVHIKKLTVGQWSV